MFIWLIWLFSSCISPAGSHVLAGEGIEHWKVRNKRQVEKPQIYSGPYPCIDKSGSPVLPPYLGGPAFWYTDDQCHISVCPGPLVITKSLGCFMKGIMCPPGSYLEVPPKPQSMANCCLCKPIEKLKKRGLKSTSFKPVFDPVLQKRAQIFIHRLHREFWEAGKRSKARRKRLYGSSRS